MTRAGKLKSFWIMFGAALLAFVAIAPPIPETPPTEAERAIAKHISPEL